MGKDEIEKFKARYGLDSVNEEDMEVIMHINNDLLTAMNLDFAKPLERGKVLYLNTLVEQNWLIINQLSRINERLDRDG